DLVSGKELAVKRSCLDLELVLTLGELFEQTGSSARVFVGESNQGRAFERVVEDREFGAFNSALEQGVTYDTYVNASLAGLFTESGHCAYSHTTGIGHDSGQSDFGSLVDFSDDGFLVFEFNCHGFTPGFYRFIWPRPDVVLVSDSVTNREHHLRGLVF